MAAWQEMTPVLPELQKVVAHCPVSPVDLLYPQSIFLVEESHDKKKSGVPFLSKFKYFDTIWEQVSDNSPTISKYFGLFDRPSKGWQLCEVGQSSSAPIRFGVQHSFERDLPCRSSKL